MPNGSPVDGAMHRLRCKDSTAVAKNSRSRVFVTVVNLCALVIGRLFTQLQGDPQFLVRQN